MILVLGGTTEGRAVIKILDEAGKEYYYSTKSSLQQVDMAHGIRLTGTLDKSSMRAFCREKGIRLIIDAAHPFAETLHLTVEETSSASGIPVIRYERMFPPRNKQFVWCKDYAEALLLLEKKNVQKLLALSGVNTITPLRPYWEKHDCWFRILDRDESRAIVEKQGFPQEKIIYYKESTNDTVAEKELICSLRPDAILTKESGFSGNFLQKTEAARQTDTPLFVIQRPETPGSFHKVYGEAGLRQQIDRLLPGFFALRTGFTTGTCATAATKAALITLLTDIKQTESEITLPSGELICLPVHATEITPEYTRCTIQKDAGDDPDVTNKSEITATIRFVISSPGLQEPIFSLPHVLIPIDASRQLILSAGEGVGRVTLPGLGLEVGGPAINLTPRKMIQEEIRTVLKQQENIPQGNIAVVISVSGGGEIAKRTFNPKLGIEGGISIIGTSGIVRPFSHEAFIQSVRKEMEVAKAMNCLHIIINSGAKSERKLKSGYPDLPPQAFIHYGNYIGETLQIASGLEIPEITLGIMIGKAVKLAEGHLDTHSKKVVMNKDFLKELAAEAGCQPETIRKINDITLARELWNIFPKEENELFYTLLTNRCYSHCRSQYPSGRLHIILIDE